MLERTQMRVTDGPRLPQEVCDQIIDHTHDDPPALRTFAIVSRAWLASARFHIFHTVCVRPVSYLDTVEPLLEVDPPLTHLVRHLVLGSRDISMALNSSLSVESVLEIIHHFPRIHALSLNTVCIKEDTAGSGTKKLPAPLVIPSALPSALRMLELREFFREQTTHPISDIITVFSSVSHLKLIRMYKNTTFFGLENTHIPHLYPHKTHVDRLTLKHVQMSEGFVQDLLVAVDMANVRYLELGYTAPGDVPPEYSVLVRASSAALKGLVVRRHGSWSRYDAEPKPSFIDLSTCSALALLEIALVLRMDDTLDMFNMISSLPLSCTLPSVKVQIKSYGTTEGDSKLLGSVPTSNWLHVGTLLRSLTHLKTVQIAFRSTILPSKETSSFIQEWLTDTLALHQGCTLGFVWEQRRTNGSYH